MRVLELFCGIGGCAAALGEAAEVVAAVDVNTNALAVYARNFAHPVQPREISSIAVEQFSRWRADLWWLSPPCQPYTARGHQRDIADPRAASLLHAMEAINRVRPPYVALENVPGFEVSQARARLLTVLEAAGYSTQERFLCPTELGVPNRRRRYYLLATRDQRFSPRLERPGNCPTRFAIRDVLDPQPAAELDVPARLIADYEGAVHVVEPQDSRAVSCCFTSAYGKSITCSGSFLRTDRGFRRFSPAEILRLMCFPETYRLPVDQSRRRLWSLLGNSLSVAAVREVLSAIP